VSSVNNAKNRSRGGYLHPLHVTLSGHITRFPFLSMHKSCTCRSRGRGPDALCGSKLGSRTVAIRSRWWRWWGHRG
jgi:hypothetical protein